MRAAAILASAALLALAPFAAAHCNYLIEEGESLYSIAEGYGISEANITALNDQIEDPNLVYAGDVIRLPCEDLEKESDVAELLAHRSDTFYAYTAIVKAGLLEALSNGGDKLTAFIPTDDAFVDFLETAKLNLTTVLSSPELLADILKYHVSADGATKAKDIEDGQELSTLLEGEDLTLAVSNGSVSVQTTSGQDVKVVLADLRGGKSVIHLIDAVLVAGPKTPEPTKPVAPAPEVAPVEPSKVPCTIVVADGDTLFDLAKKYGTTVEALLKLNKAIKDEDLIIIGSTLVLKEGKGCAAPGPKAASRRMRL